MGGYRGMSGYWNEYGTFIVEDWLLPNKQVSFTFPTRPCSTHLHTWVEWNIPEQSALLKQHNSRLNSRFHDHTLLFVINAHL